MSSYLIDQSGPNIRVRGRFGVGAGGTDLQFSIELFQFADQTRTAATILNPLVPVPSPPSTGTPTTPGIPTPLSTQRLRLPQRLRGTQTLRGTRLRLHLTFWKLSRSSRSSSPTAMAAIRLSSLAMPSRRQKLRLTSTRFLLRPEWISSGFRPKTLNNTFFNVGNSSNRPGSDLNRIVSSGDSSGIGSSNRNVIDMYFVERVPGFTDVNEFTANGLAFVGASGIAMQTGDRLVGFANGRDTVAHVAAHEIGHNLACNMSLIPTTC